MIVESANQAPEPPQRFRSGVHDLREDCDAVGACQLTKIKNYNKFTQILQQFYNNLTSGTDIRLVVL